MLDRQWLKDREDRLDKEQREWQARRVRPKKLATEGKVRIGAALVVAVLFLVLIIAFIMLPVFNPQCLGAVH